MPVMFTQPVTLLTRSAGDVDSYGNDVLTATQSVVNGVVAPGGSTETLTGGDQVVTQPTAYLPAGVDVTAIDALTANGVTYEVDGDVQDWTSSPNPFTGWLPELPVVVRLKRVTG